MTCSGTVDSLLNCCMYTVARHMMSHYFDLSSIPINLKERMIYLLSKRGLITDSNISLCVSSSMTSVDLTECGVSDVTLSTIAASCPRLKKIDLNAIKYNRKEITSEGIIALSKGCSGLLTVFLRRCVRIADDAIVSLSENCPRLEQLNVGACPRITDQSLIALGTNSSKLSCLNISGTKITDAGIQSLCEGLLSSMLNELHINNCLNLTDESVNYVTRSCPKIKILLLHGCPNMTEATRSVISHLSNQMRQVTWSIY